MLKYKGYSGHVEYDGQARIFCGEVLDTRDVITFQGKSVEEIERAFRDSVDDYLEFCSSRGEQPDKPFSGRFVLRMSPEIHRNIALKASQSGKSINKWVLDVLTEQP